MTTLDFIIFLVYIVGVTLFGSSFYKRQRTAIGFTLGNQRVPTWVVTMSIFATFVSSISYLALPGSAYLTNWNAFVFSLSIPFAAWMATRFFVPLYRSINSPSAYTYLEQRFGSWARIYVSICYLLTQLMRVGTILYLLALALSTMISWNIATIIIITGIVVLIYSVLGGIQAVVWTDAIQGIILISGAILCAIYILWQLPGGGSQLIELASQNQKFSLGSYAFHWSEPTFWVVLSMGYSLICKILVLTKTIFNVIWWLKATVKLNVLRFWEALFTFRYLPFFYLLALPFLLIIRYFPDSLPSDLPSDQVFPHFIVHSLPPGLTGLLVASIFAAGMSTVSTSFNSAATVFLTDYYQKFSSQPTTDEQAIKVLYIASFIISLIAIGIALAMINVKSALDSWWTLASIFSGGMLGLFLLGAFTTTKNQWGAIIGALLGGALICWLSLTTNHALHSYLTIVLGTTVIFLVGFLFAWALPDTAQER